MKLKLRVFLSSIFPNLQWFVYPAKNGDMRLVLIRMFLGKEKYRREFVISGTYNKNNIGIGTKFDQRKEAIVNDFLALKLDK